MARVIALVLLSFALIAGSAQAQATNAPPGNSGVDQYLESVPGTTGNTPSRRNGSSSSSAPVLSSSQQRALAAQGADGNAAAELTDRYGVSRKDRSRAQASPQQASGTKHSSSSGGSVVSSLSSAVLPSDGAGGLGPALPILLLATAAAGAGAALIRRSRSH